MSRASVADRHPDPGQGVTLRRRSARGELHAAVDLLGGGLRALDLGGVDLVETYPPGSASPCCAGAVLFPWPNRVRDGRWTQRGARHQLAVTEPELGNANHGLVRSTPFTVEASSDSEVVLAISVAPQPGYPFRVRLQLSYRLTDDGLEVDGVVTNESAVPAPVALGAHPYLRVGDCPTADLSLRVDAGTFFAVDDRLVPVREVAVAGTEVDFRAPRRIGRTELNACFGELGATDGRRRTVVSAPDGREVELWASEAFAYVQVYTCADYPRADGPGRALAIEPMTAPGNALNSGVGLTWLEPARTLRASWGIRAGGPAGCWG